MTQVLTVAIPSHTLADNLRKQGLAALRGGDPNAALDAFASAVRLAPDDPEMHQGLGAAALALADYEAAKDAYAAAVALDPRRVDALRGLGHCARRAGARAEALRWFETACEVAPRIATHHHERGEELRALGRSHDAKEAFGRALALQPDHRPSLLSCAALARASGDDAAALQALEAAEGCGPGDGRIGRDIADTLFRLGRLDQAEAKYAGLCDTEALRFEALRGLAKVAVQRRDRAAALDHLRRAAALPVDPHRALDVAKQRMALGDAAEEAYGPALSNERTRRDALIALAAHARQARDPACARDLLEMMASADPTDRTTGLALAELYGAGWELDQADDLLRRLAALFPDDFDVLTARGRLARLRGSHGEARDFFEQAYRLNPLTGATELACACRNAGDHDQARAILEQLRTERPDDASVLVQLGVTARGGGDARAALDHFDQALGRAPDNISAAVEKAALLQRLGRLAEMRAVLGEAAVRAPNHPRMIQALADLALAEDDPGRALTLLDQVAGERSCAWLPLKVARCEAALGRIDDALRTIDAAVASSGASPDAVLLKAQILRQNGRLPEAEHAFDAAVQRFPFSFQLWFQRVLFLAETGRGAGARLDLDRCPASTDSERAKAATVCGVLASARWNFARARRHYRTALAGNASDAALRARLATAALLDLDLTEAVAQLRELARLEAPARRLRGQSLGPFQTLAGQILEEARIDRVGLERLIAAGCTPPRLRLGALSAVVRDFPDLTLAAMQLLLTLRRERVLDAGGGLGTESKIPKTIVQFWHAEDPPADVLDLMRSWADHNPDFTYRRFTDRTARQFIEAEYPDAVTQAYVRARDPARKADIFRLAYLLRFGGLYADADDRCAAPVRSLLSKGGSLVLYQEDIGSIGNNIIMAASNHPVLRQALDLAVASAMAGDNDIPWLATGPGLLTRVIARAVAEGGRAEIDTMGLRILTRRALLPVTAIGCMTAYKHTRRHWSRAAFLAPSARSNPGGDQKGRPPLNTEEKEVR